jgi:hypothetical protein
MTGRGKLAAILSAAFVGAFCGAPKISQIAAARRSPLRRKRLLSSTD